MLLTSRLPAQDGFDVKAVFSPQSGVGDEFGRATCVVDVDRDGFADIVALESGEFVDGAVAAGMGWVFYGPTFQTATSFTAREPAPGEHLGGGGCCAGDVNGDGWPDVLVGSPDYVDGGMPDAGRAHVFLGPDFLVDIALHDPVPEANARMGDHGLLLHDVDGDGRDDVFVGCLRHDQRLSDGTIVEDSGRLYHWPSDVLLSATGDVLPIIIENPVPEEDGSFGAIVIPVDEPGPPSLMVSKADLVLQLDAATFGLLGTVPPPSLPGVSQFGTALATGLLGPGDEFGMLVTAVGSSFPGCGNAGAAFVLGGSGLASLVFTLVSPDACNGEKQFFGTRCMALDVDLDGQEDLILSDPSKRDDGWVRIFWGPDYTSFATLGTGLGPVLTTGFGNYLAAGDIDADGFDELVVYASMGAGSGGLFIHNWRTLTSSVDSLAIATGGDAQFTLDLSPAQGGKTYVAALGISGSEPGVIAGKGSYVPLNVDAVTLAGLALIGTPLLDDFAGSLDADGRATFTLHLPGGFPAALAGSTLTVAAVVIEPNGRPGAGSSPAHIVLTL